MFGKKVLLVIAGGISAYKSLELIRRLRDRGVMVRCVLTKSGAEFVTPLAVSALSENKVYQELFSLTDESEMGHIRLSRDNDLVVIAPLTADLMAKMAHGLANDLASTLLLATDKPVLAAPAMNGQMWQHPANQRNFSQLKMDGIHFVGPNPGDMACGETGVGRMAEVPEILAAIEAILNPAAQPLTGKKFIVTSGPTREAIDPVRYISNHSSGKQGHAIAEALAGAGAEVVLVSGPVAIADPVAVKVIKVESAQEMLAMVHEQLPADGVVCAAAVADWRVDTIANHKTKKAKTGEPPALKLVENPDILATISQMKEGRPKLVVGFAAETEELEPHAQAKLARKKCDWILANDVSPDQAIFGGDQNQVLWMNAKGEKEHWPRMDKAAVADHLVKKIIGFFQEK